MPPPPAPFEPDSGVVSGVVWLLPAAAFCLLRFPLLLQMFIELMATTVAEPGAAAANPAQEDLQPLLCH